MTRRTLRPRDRRALRLGALVAGPVLAVLLVVQPYARALLAARADAAIQRELLARELGALRDGPRDARLARAATVALAAEAGRLFDGGDEVAASAELAGYVSDLAEESGLELDGSETRPPADGDSSVAVEIRALGDIVSISLFLQALEEGPKLVHAERITIAVPAGGRDVDGVLALTASVTGRSRRAYVDAHLDPVLATHEDTGQ